MELKTKNK